ncbi:MAG TPA: hypothetical protein VF487_13390 [Chitinophagaceae bacterium]
MIKIICCGLLLTWGMQSKAQQTLLDSLRALPQKLTIDGNVSIANCATRITTYKNKFAGISVGQLEPTLKTVHKAYTESPYPNVKNCPSSLAIFRIDSMINAQPPNDFPDSLKILQAIASAKYHFAGKLRLQVVVPDSILKGQQPTISLQSFESFIILPLIDSMPFEAFVDSGKKYTLSINVSGYETDMRGIRCIKDTLVTIDSLKVISGATPEPWPIVPSPKNFLEKFWWAGAILLTIAGLVFGRIIFGRDNKTKSQKTDTGLQTELLEKNKIIENNRKQIERLHADHLALAKTVKENKTGMDLLSSRHFVSEIMMTAGPRKKPMNEPNSDKDLGEDVCGFVTVGDQLLVWLLDGTSDLYCLRNPVNKREYFSSRLLAQSIARGLKTHFLINKLGSLDEAMIKVLTEVKNDWMHTIKNLPESEKNVLKNNIRQANFPECAATVLVGRLSLDGTLNVYRSGDSKMFLFADNRNFLNTSLGDKNVKSNDRVFFRIVSDQAGEPDILHNQPLFESNSYSHIETMIGFSDGIGKETEEQFQKAFAKNPEEVREEIMYQLQGTEDDKALFIIEIKS